MPFNFMYFILGDRAGKEKFTSLGVEPNTNSTRRAGLLAATVGLPGLIIGTRDAQREAEAAAAAAAQTTPAVEVPDVRGATLDGAITQLKAAGLKLRATSAEPSAPDAKDKVTRTDPPAGSPLPEDLNVTIFLGSGTPPDPVKVPEVTGKTLIEARPLIQAAGLEISGVSTEPSSPDKKDKITRTSPAAGSDLPADLKIAVFLGTGTLAKVPDVKGKGLVEATTIITDAGGKVKEALTEPSAAADKDKVTSTDPAAGLDLPADGVRVFIGTGKN